MRRIYSLLAYITCLVRTYLVLQVQLTVRPRSLLSCRLTADECSGPSLGWRVLLTMAQSMVPGQQTAAWNSLAALPMDADSGYALTGPIGRLTRTAAKWWIATRPA
jgi:predicted component of type VI protein secretion system